MSGDDYELLCENAEIAESMGISKQDLKVICDAMKKETLRTNSEDACAHKLACDVRGCLARKKENKF